MEKFTTTAISDGALDEYLRDVRPEALPVGGYLCLRVTGRWNECIGRNGDFVGGQVWSCIHCCAEFHARGTSNPPRWLISPHFDGACVRR